MRRDLNEVLRQFSAALQHVGRMATAVEHLSNTRTVDRLELGHLTRAVNRLAKHLGVRGVAGEEENGRSASHG